MALEAATYINQLNSSNPTHTDGLNQADSHLRLLKATLQATFPGITGATLVTQADLDSLHNGTFPFPDGSSGAPSIHFASEATLGFYRIGSTKTGFTGRLFGNGAVPVGAIVDFPIAPTDPAYLECDGTTKLIADYPDLAAFLGTTFGGNGTTTFGLPNCTDTGRYRRSRSGSLTAGTYQSNQNKAHTHNVTGSTDSQGAHTHTGTTDSGGVDHTHASDYPGSVGGAYGGGGQTALDVNIASHTTRTTSGASAYSHTHTFTTGSAGAHTHAVAGTTDSNGGSEARPETLVVVTCIKT